MLKQKLFHIRFFNKTKFRYFPIAIVAKTCPMEINKERCFFSNNEAISSKKTFLLHGDAAIGRNVLRQVAYYTPLRFEHKLVYEKPHNFFPRLVLQIYKKFLELP